ncbi:MAG: electron transfer flavoprotein subunit alpha/FixB family protein [Euryarchaeota archaeon]|nr:electron transfer flavoprotein subunit alpha/FixB family protein [Euryarchaeota archaeon]
MSDIWVVAEVRDGAVKRTTLECLGKARELAGAAGGKTGAVLIGPEGLAKTLGAHGAQRVFVADDPRLKNYGAEAYAAIVSGLVAQHKPGAVLAGATSYGKDLLPRVAARTGAGLATDCTDLQWKDGKLVALRPVYAGKARTTVTFTTPIQMATLRPNAVPVPPANPGAAPETVKVPVQVDDNALKTIVKETAKTATGGAIELTEASIICSGGRGMKDPANFKIIHDLAAELGAAVGASRAVVDAGWKPHSFQVGQTGKTVSPNIYIASGISGAIQHLAGMSSSKCIVAINKDPNAPIFKVADYGIVGDLFQIVPALTEEARKLKAKG